MTDDRRPAGTPVGRAFDISAGIAYDDLREVVAAIDRVHGDGELPRIPVRLIAGLTSRGRFRFDPTSGPLSITLRANYAYSGLTFVHEIGHLLDLVVFGNGREFGSVRDPLLNRWRSAIEESELFHVLDSMVRNGVASVHKAEDSTQFLVLADNELSAVRRARQMDEMWACSYAQYVAVRSRLASLIENLAGLRVRSQGKVYYPRQWDDNDFRPIETAIDDVMSQLGWRL